MIPLSQQTRGIAAVLLNNVLLGFAVGMFLPFVPLRLHELGVSAGLIGLNAAASSVAVLGIASVTTRILRRIGYPTAIGVGAMLFAIALLGMMWWRRSSAPGRPAVSLPDSGWPCTGFRVKAGSTRPPPMPAADASSPST